MGKGTEEMYLGVRRRDLYDFTARIELRVLSKLKWIEALTLNSFKGKWVDGSFEEQETGGSRCIPEIRLFTCWKNNMKIFDN